MMSAHTLKNQPQDWPKDNNFDSIRYECTCYSCGVIFRADKYRTICRVCALKALQEAPNE